MKAFTTLLALPASLLSIVAVHAQELPWPYNLPRTVKYYPEHEAHVKREVEVQERLAWQAPAAVKKMSDDLGEKFILDYWGFEDPSWTGLDSDSEMLHDERYSNVSLDIPLFPAIAPHTKNDTAMSWLFRRNFFKRDFTCPTGTRSCIAINAPHLCCDFDETCVSTSAGVGCCPAGAVCGNEVSGCDTNAGFTSCPDSPNGGCCIPGAVCEGIGCVYRGTSTITTTLATATRTSGVTFSTQTSGGRTVTIAYPVTQISVTTKTVTLTPSQSSSALTCKVGFFSCPGASGGGCCPNGQACGTSSSCPDFTSATAAPPVPATSESPETTSTTTVSGCPTGYYQCSARYLGGCCRVGRDCQTTSCPPQDTTTIINSGVTVANTSPAGGAVVATQGSCANGWFLCGARGGGGCCPSGYVCGGVSCSATNPGQKDTLKMTPSSANMLRWAWGLVALGVITGVGMIVA